MFSTVSCDKIFDSLEGDLTKMTAEDLMKSETGVQGLLANIYSYIPMDAFNTGDRSTLLAAGRIGGAAGYGASAGSSFWNYTQMRVVNKFIEDLDMVYEKNVINEAAYNTYKGEAKFIRAYLYFCGVRNLGGMPIVTKTLDNELDGGENLGLFIPRSTEFDTWDWICNELEEAAEMLPESIIGGPLRANKYVAYALESRVALWAASVAKYQDKAGRKLNDQYSSVKQNLTRIVKPDGGAADTYFYTKCIAASEKVINSGKYALYGAHPASVDAATTNLIDLFQNIKYDEYIFGKTYNTGINSSDNGTESWGPYQVASANYMEGNGAITANMVDYFANYGPNRETRSGTVKTLKSGSEDYYLNSPYDNASQIEEKLSQLQRYNSIDEPFKNKDARFQAWVVYPGSTFRNEVMNMQAGLITADGKSVLMPVSKEVKGYDYNGQTYYPYGINSSVAQDYSAFYGIKEDYNGVNCYEYCFGTKKFLNQNERVVYTQSPWYDIRYAEILLNYAEAVAESNLGDKTLAANCLNDVHERAGFARDLTLSVDNVLNEVRVEFMAENHWQSVLWRRREYITTSAGADNSREGAIHQKITFLPMLDLSNADGSGAVKYVFPRALPYYSSYGKIQRDLIFDVKPDSYYGQVSNYQNNRITPNKIVE